MVCVLVNVLVRIEFNECKHLKSGVPHGVLQNKDNRLEIPSGKELLEAINEAFNKTSREGKVN